MEAKVRYTGYAGYGFLSFGKRDTGESELSHKERLIERLEQRFKEQQASLRFITVGSLAMALSACKDDTLVQGSDTDDIFGNTPADEIFKGRLGDDVYSYFLSGVDRIIDTGGNDELRVSIADAGGDRVETSFNRIGDDLVVTQAGEGNSVTVEGAFVGATTLEQLTLVYEDSNRPNLGFELNNENALDDLNKSLLTDDISTRLSSKTFTDSGDETKISVGSSVQMSMLSADTKTSLGMGPFRESEFSSYQGEGYTVVVIDTGIDLDHSAFGPDSNGDGISDRILYSQDFSSDGDGTADDVNGHGSNVASIIGSSDDQYLGVAPKVNLIALQGLSNSGGGSTSSVEEALQWVIENAENYNIVAVNMSLGEGNNSNKSEEHSAYHDELNIIKSKGIVTVVAAGNDYYKYQDTGPSPGVGAPANDPNVIPVGAVWQESVGRFNWAAGAKDFRTASDRVTSFSQRSTDVEVIFAQGALIAGAKPGGGVGSQGGTSQATPFVAGMVAVAQNMADDLLGRRLTPDEFETMLRSSATTIFDGDDERDNVASLDTPLPRVDMLALAQEIKKLAETVEVSSEIIADDFNEGIDTTGIIEVGTQIAGNLEKATDNDWLKVDLKAGQIYGISVKARVSSEGTLLDPMLTLYDQNGALIISNDDGGVETEPYIEFTPANDQSFYVSVSSYGADETGLGTYLLEVNDLGLAQSDDFTSDALTKSILTFDERTNFAFVNGSLEFLGDVDWHAVDLTGRNTYIIDVSGHGEAALEDPYLKVFDVDGNLVVSNDDGGTDSNARLRFSPDEDEKYFIEASGYNNSYVGDYTVNLTEIDTAKDIPNDASTNAIVAVGESFSGLLEFEGDRDWIKADLVGGSVYNVTLEGDQSASSGDEQILPLEDPHLRLFDGRGNLIAENDDLEGRNSGLTNLSVDETGTYFFSAGAYGDSGVGSYDLFLDESIIAGDVVPNDITTTFSLNGNETFTNNLEAFGDRDWVKVALGSGKTYEIDLVGSGENPVGDTFLRLYDENGWWVDENDDGPVNADSKLNYSPTVSGSYFIEVASFNDEFTGTYSLSYNERENIDDFPLGLDTDVALNEQSIQEGTINIVGDKDYFKFTTNANAIYEFTLESRNSDTPLEDPLLTIVDQSGDILAVNDDHEGTLNSKITLVSDATSTVYLVASSYDEIGDYVLGTVVIAEGFFDDHLNDFTTTSSLTLNEQMSGDLENFDEIDMFVVNLEGGQTYDFRVLASASDGGTLADPILTLYDQNENWLDYNDDTFGYDPFIGGFVAGYSGDHYLEVKRYSDAGTYTVLAQEGQALIDDHLNDFTTTSRLTLNEQTAGDLENFDEIDMFVVNLEEGQNYEFRVLGLDTGGGTLADPDLYIFDKFGKELAYNYDTFGLDPFIGNFVAGYDGDHYLEVKRYSDAGTYNVLAQEGQALIDDHLNDFKTTSRLTLNEKMSGDLEYFDEIDMFVVNLEGGQTYDFRVLALDTDGGTLADPDLYIFDKFGNELAYNYDTFGLDPFIGNFIAGYDGDHYLEVKKYSGVGTYSVLAQEGQALIDDHLNDFTTTSRLTLNEQMTGDLENFDEIDMFVVNLERAQTYDFRVLASDSGGGTLADPILTLYDQNENRLDYNDDTFGYDPFIGGFVAGYDGDHYLEVKRMSDAGTYTVLAEEAQALIDDHLNDLTTTSRLSIGERMDGELEAFGDEKDMFVVNLEEGQTYDFRVFAWDSGGGSLDDPILTLYDQNENRLDYNDDTFGYEPFIESFVAVYDGEHYLAVGGYGDVGTYTILAVENNIIL